MVTWAFDTVFGSRSPGVCAVDAPRCLPYRAVMANLCQGPLWFAGRDASRGFRWHAQPSARIRGVVCPAIVVISIVTNHLIFFAIAPL